MRKFSIFYIICMICFSKDAYSDLISKAILENSDGKVIIELYDDVPLIKECRGTNSLGAIVNLDAGKGIVGFGTGCWTTDTEGYIHLRIKSLDDGITRESSIHNSKFISSYQEEKVSNEIGLIAIKNDDPVLEYWKKASPVYSVLENCKLFDHISAMKGGASGYNFASIDPHVDLFVYKEINNKAHWAYVYATSELRCQKVKATLSSAKSIGLNIKGDLKKARFGIGVDDLPSSMSTKFKQGALVVSVLEASAAFRSGVKVNDIIISVDGVEVKSAKDALKAMRNTPAVAKKSTLTVLRKGSRVVLTVIF